MHMRTLNISSKSMYYFEYQLLYFCKWDVHIYRDQLRDFKQKNLNLH